MERLIPEIKKCGVADVAIINYEDCEIINERLASNIGFAPKSVYICTVPYYTKFCNEIKTVSAYALAYDYHTLIQNIGEAVVANAKSIFPSNNFRFFGDHSPINEKKAAAKAGLGIIGAHSLLITPEYSSYVFLCELFTDLDCDAAAQEIKYCENCGRCINACPGFLSGTCDCLSSITQKKGELSEEEKELIRKYKTVWGCDICQEVCPHTIKAIKNGEIYTNVNWFESNVITCPDEESINNVTDFGSRAYSWRGINTIMRNINILNEVDKD